MCVCVSAYHFYSLNIKWIKNTDIYNWSLNNMGLNRMGLLTCGVFSTKATLSVPASPDSPSSSSTSSTSATAETERSTPPLPLHFRLLIVKVVMNMKTFIIIHYHLMKRKYIFSSLIIFLITFSFPSLYCTDTVCNTYSIQNMC